MTFSYNKMLIIIVVMMLAIFVASPQGGVEGRPLLLHFQRAREYGLLLQALPNGSAPATGGSNDHP
ncbi:hypothetical protein Lal_00018096 [Lupinus albus]|uniref:Uncharacterized protein n=1 Tax=Lupinus albus TaxID=3870 RepID=A0A6A4NE41_LUPAL|nr:hypothetical protein Lalb_Chr25g0290021 [Lupinus albus]KAF1866711.1 hypothetical protein Lal_00018096 [Lupinus albus]